LRARLGEQDLADKKLSEYQGRHAKEITGEWPANIARYLLGRLSRAEFMKASQSTEEKKTREQECEAYFYAGTKELIGGNKNTAREYFTKCLGTGVKTFREYSSAAAELKLMDQQK
jgi:lipoprotein NlpI